MIKIKYFLIWFTLITCSIKNDVKIVEKTIFPDKTWGDGKYREIEKIAASLDNDNIDDTIRIYTIPDWSDPGDFHKISIELSTGNHTNILNLGDWINMSTSQVEEYSSINNIASKRLVVTASSKDKILIIIFGYTYASSPGRLTVLKVENNDVNVVLSDLFELQSIIDFDNDGELELIGQKYYREACCYQDSVSNGTTYCPYYVMSVQSDTLVANDELSEKYNIVNYAGYFGLDFDSEQRYAVVLPYGGEFSDSYFLFEKSRKYPEASLRYLTKDELSDYSKDELRLIRNEIFAFHGHEFKSEDLKDYFSKQEWYVPTKLDYNKRMNSFEKANVKLIKELEGQ